MKIIGKLILKNKPPVILGQPWLDDEGQPKTVQIEGRKEKLRVILGGIRYVPEKRVELYDEDVLDETLVTPAKYELFGFIPFVDSNGQPSGMPHTEVDTIWATEVDGYRELWLRDSVLDAYDDIKRSDDDEDEDEDEGKPATPVDNGQPQPAPSP